MTSNWVMIEEGLEDAIINLQHQIETKSVLLPVEEDFFCNPVLSVLGKESLSDPVLIATNNCLSSLVLRLREEKISDLMERLYDLYLQDELRQRVVESMKSIIVALPAFNGRSSSSGVVDEDEIRGHNLVKQVVSFWMARLLAKITKDNVQNNLAIIKLLQERFGALIQSISKYRNVQFLDEYFITGYDLGRGNFATVYLGFHSVTGEKVAVKVMDWDKLTYKNPKIAEQLQIEIDVMEKNSHLNLVKLYKHVRDGSLLYLIMEFCSGGTLAEYINRSYNRKQKCCLSEAQARPIMQQLARGLKFLRSKRIAHRDLKPGNILLHFPVHDNQIPVVKITDFTFARVLDSGDMATTLCGSPLYMAPEIFLDKKYTDKSDLWSVGVMFYQMLVGEVPYFGETIVHLISALQTKPYRMPRHISTTLSKDALGCLHALLQIDPTQRAGWEEFFLHPFIGLHHSSPLSGSLMISSSIHASRHTDAKENADVESLTQQILALRKENEAYALKEAKWQETKARLEKEINRKQEIHKINQEKYKESIEKAEQLVRELRHKEQVLTSTLDDKDRDLKESQKHVEGALALLRKKKTEAENLSTTVSDVESELSLARARIADLEKEAECSTKQISTLYQELEESKLEAEDARRGYSTSQRELSEVRGELQSVSSKCEQLQSTLQDLQTENEAKDDQLTSLQQQLRDAEELNEQLQKELAGVRRAQEDTCDKLKSEEDEVKQLRRKLTELRDSSRSLEAELKQSVSNREQLSKEVEAYRHSAAQKQEDLERQLSSLNAELIDSQDLVSHFQSNLEASQETVTKQQQKIEELMKIVDQYAATTAEILQCPMSSDHEKNATSLKSWMVELQQRIDNATSQHERIVEQKHDLQGQLNTARSSLAKAGELEESLRKKLDQAERKIQEYTSQLSSMEAECRASLQKLQDECESYSVQLDRQRQMNQDAEAVRARLKEQEDLVAQFQEALDRNRSRSEGADKEVANLTNCIDLLERHCEHQKTIINAYHSTVCDIVGATTEINVEEEIQHLRSKWAELKEEVQQKDHEISSIQNELAAFRVLFTDMSIPSS